MTPSWPLQPCPAWAGAVGSISRLVLSQAAGAIVGICRAPVAASANDKPAVGLTMFGVTTPAVTAIAEHMKPSLFKALKKRLAT